MTPIQAGNKTIVNLLWTGGWDSTFRLLQVSAKDVVVQPHYLMDDSRKSQKFELNTIDLLTGKIRNLASAKCILRDPVMVDLSNIKADKEVTRAYEAIAKKHQLGIQYEWLARYSKTVKNLEIGDENGRAPGSILLKAITENGALKKVADPCKGEYYLVDESVSSREVMQVFGNYHYPILFYNKLEMKQEAEAMGYIDLMNATWFCHTPLNNQPCGTCAACAGTIKKGLEHRLNEAALRRYRRKKLTDPLRSTRLYKNLGDLKKFFYSAMRPPSTPAPGTASSSKALSGNA